MTGRPAGDTVTRILNRIDTRGHCWLWTGSPTGGGYGAITISRRRWTATRAVYTWLVRPIPDRHDIRHTCATPMCVRPEHLRAVPRNKVIPPEKTGPAAARRAHADTASRAPAVTDTYVDWRHRAACRGQDPELFFPTGDTGPALLQIDKAKAVCRRCPSVESCLGWALSSNQSAGVWGGLSERERASLKRHSHPSRRPA